MKPGKTVDCFTVKKENKETEIIFRYPSLEDTKEAMQFINAARKEHRFLAERKTETMESEKKFIQSALENMKKKRALLLFAESNGKIIGDASLLPHKKEALFHIGIFGIVLRKEFTGLGIGTRLAEKLFELARKETGFEIVSSKHFSENKKSAALHKKLGFKKYGLFPREFKLKNKTYNNGIHYYKEL